MGELPIPAEDSMRYGLTAVLLLLPSLAMSADLEISSRVDRVTVYPDAALVTRLGTVELPAGASTLTLRGLPAAIDPASIRVEGQGNAAFAIGSVDLRTVPGEARPTASPELDAKVRALRDEREAVGGRINAAEVKKGAIERYAQASPERLGEEKPLDVGQWAAAWDVIGGGLAAVNEELRPLRRRARELDEEIAALEAARAHPARPGQPRRDLTVTVEADAALKGEIRVSYRVAGAAWTPLYDARLDTERAGGAGLELVRRAQVSQRTGEDWSDVALAVSTVRVTRGTVAPDLAPQQVLFYEPPVVYRGEPPRARSMAAPGAAPPPAPAQEVAAAPPPPPVPAREVEAGAEGGAFQATFTVPGRVSVVQDGTVKSFVLGRRAIQPSLLVRAVPSLDTTAYLEASFTNEDEAALLPGEVALHRDGTYVGRARLKLTAAGDRVELGFGADDRVKVTRVPVRRRESEPGWIGSTRSELREFKTTVRNLHATPIRVVVVDRIPFSENDAIKVEQARETTPPTEARVEDKRGVMAWSYDYAPGEARDIRLVYRLRWPAEREVTYQDRPIGR